MSGINGEDGGLPHIRIGVPPAPDSRITDLYVLVATNENGGEGIYGASVGNYMVNFVAESVQVRDAMEDFLRGHGSIEVCRREGIKLEWVRFGITSDRVEIT